MEVVYFYLTLKLFIYDRKEGLYGDLKRRSLLLNSDLLSLVEGWVD